MGGKWGTPVAIIGWLCFSGLVLFVVWIIYVALPALVHSALGW